jgi:hypothetical protein
MFLGMAAGPALGSGLKFLGGQNKPLFVFFAALVRRKRLSSIAGVAHI